MSLRGLTKMYVQVRIMDRQNTMRFLRTTPRRTATVSKREMWNLARKGASLIKESARESGIKEWRNKMINPIMAKKIGKGRYKIVIPKIIARLDYMPGHYVALKPGRLITEWAKDRYGTKRVSGLSVICICSYRRKLATHEKAIHPTAKAVSRWPARDGSRESSATLPMPTRASNTA